MYYSIPLVERTKIKAPWPYYKDLERIYEWQDNAMTFGIKEANKIEKRKLNMKDFQEIKGTMDTFAPVLFEAEYPASIELNEPGGTLTVRGWSTQDLVSFGNYVLSSYREELINTHPALTPSDIDVASKVVSDADLSNWRFLALQNEHPLQTAVPEDDDSFPRDGTIMGEEE